MAARHGIDVNLDRVEGLLHALVPFADTVRFLLCPKCGCRSLNIDMMAGVGARVYCAGYSRNQVDEDCGFWLVEHTLSDEQLPPFPSGDGHPKITQKRRRAKPAAAKPATKIVKKPTTRKVK